MLIEFEKMSPMIIGIWFGESKPILHEYVHLLISELETILSSGIFVNDHRVQIKFGLVICDTPARSLMKGNKASFLKHVKYFETETNLYSCEPHQFEFNCNLLEILKPKI